MRRITLQRKHEDDMAFGPRLIMLYLFPIFLCIFFLSFDPHGWLESLSSLASVVAGQRKSPDMAWPWRFVTLSEEELTLRRQLLDRHGAYAQLSAAVPVLVYLLYRLGVWVLSQRRRVDPGYQALPSRTGSVPRKGRKFSSVGALKSQWRLVSWWLDGQAFVGWGTRGHWIAGVSWTSWLLFLSVHQTGDGM